MLTLLSFTSISLAVVERTDNVPEHFFGADEALTDFAPGHFPWVATLIITGDSREEAWNRRCRVIEDIRDYFGLSVYSDPIPNCVRLRALRR